MATPPRGTDLARSLGPEHAHHADAIEAMLQQLLIALVKRAGGKLAVPVKEIDDTGGYMLAMRVDYDTGTFHFETERKQ